MITLQRCAIFCCTTSWISCVNTYIPLSFESSSHSPPPPHPSRSSQSTDWAPCSIQQLPTSYLFWTWSCIYVNTTISPHHHPLLTPLCPPVHSLCLCLYSCMADRFISTIFPRSHIYVFIYGIFFLEYVLFFLFFALQCCVAFCHTTWISHKYTYIPFSWTSLPFHSPASHPCRSSQSSGLISLCYRATSLWLSLLHIVMNIIVMSIFQCYWYLFFSKPIFF